MSKCYNCRYFRISEKKCGYSGYSRSENDDCVNAEYKYYGDKCCGNCKYYRVNDKICSKTGNKHDQWESCGIYGHSPA